MFGGRWDWLMELMQGALLVGSIFLAAVVFVAGALLFRHQKPFLATMLVVGALCTIVSSAFLTQLPKFAEEFYTRYPNKAGLIIEAFYSLGWLGRASEVAAIIILVLSIRALQSRIESVEAASGRSPGP